MIVTIMQPAYLPWLGYFHRIMCADVMVLLDHVQIDRNSKTKFTNRNRVRTPDGWTWLTVPIRSKGLHGDLRINEIEVNHESDWATKHWKTLKSCYGKAAHFREHAAKIESIYENRWPLLSDWAGATTDYLLREAFAIKTPVVSSASLGIASQKEQLILDICVALRATQYISGPFGRDYLDIGKFEAAGIDVVFHDYAHPHYEQAFDGFQPYMSAIDLLFNCGSAGVDIIKTNQSLKVHSK